MKQRIKIAAVLVAAAVALTGTALAVGPTLQELITQALGSFAPYAQEVDGVSATDQGIKITVQSAVVDRNEGLIYLTVQDLKGNRLQDGAGDFVSRVYRGDRISYSQVQYISYDAASKTTLYSMKFQHQNFLASSEQNLPAQIEIERIDPGFRSLGYSPWQSIPLPQALLTDKTMDTLVLETGETVLAPQQTPAELENAKGISVSSIGFDTNGYLHIQLQLPKEAIPDESWLASTIRSRSGKQETEIRYNTQFDTVNFKHNGVNYCDLLYKATADDFADIKLEMLYGYLYTAPNIDGNWVLTTPLTDLSERVIAMDAKLGQNEVKEAYLTSLSATILSESQQNTTEKNVWSSILTVYLKDGTSFTLEGQGKAYGENLGNGRVGWYSSWIFDEAIDPKYVTALAIGQWYMPLDGNTALPGHWLDALPG